MGQRSVFNRNKLAFFVLSGMRSFLFYILLFSILFTACTLKPEDPAKNAVKLSFKIARFDTDFFSMDTNHIAKEVHNLYQKHPLFSDDFFRLILMSNPLKDTLSIKAFYRSYLPIYKLSKKINAPNLVHQDIVSGLSKFHFYFPTYTMPTSIIYFIGPLEGYGNVITKQGIAVGLQMYLGANTPWYFSEQIQSIYPTYISRKFEPAYIPVVAIRNILDDFASSKPIGKNVLTNMVEAGKRQYIIKSCLPQTADSLIWGYSNKQLAALKTNENEIWSFIKNQKLIYSAAQRDVQDLMHDAAHNDYFGEDIPGDVGSYIGYQIVEAWMAKQSEKTRANLLTLLNKPAEQLFEEAKYNP
jgi:hypothetical protein